MLAMRVGEDSDMSDVDPKVKTLLELVKEQFQELNTLVSINVKNITANTTNLNNLKNDQNNQVTNLNKSIKYEKDESTKLFSEITREFTSLNTLIDKNKEALDLENFKFENSLKGIIVYVEGDCPPGWSEFTKYKGRTVLFTGGNKDIKDNIKNGTNVGGASTVKINENNLPDHQHTYQKSNSINR